MLSVLSRIPVRTQKPLAEGLLFAAVPVSLFGLLLVMAFTETTKTESSGHLWWKEDTTTQIPLSERMPYLLIGICLFVVAILCLVAAIKLITTQGRLKKYPPILVGVESMTIQQIADITNSSRSKVYRDIQTLIDSGIVENFYIDHKAERVVSKKYIPERSHKTVVTCSGCGGNNELIVGITRTCSFCGQPLVLKAP